MKPKYLVVFLWGATIISLLSAVFGSFSVGHAQSEAGWSDPVNLSNSGASKNPAMVVDSQGKIHIVWLDEFEGYRYVQSTDGGESWTSPKTLRFPFSSEKNAQPVFLAGPGDDIYVLWQDADLGLHYSHAVSSTFEQPSTWTGTTKLADAVLVFDAVVSSQNILHITYATTGGLEPDSSGVYYRQFNRSSWSPATSLYSSKYFRSLEAPNANVSVAARSEGTADHVIVAWDDRSQKRIFVAQSVTGGSAWDDVRQISGPEEFAGLEMPFNIKVSAADNNILLLWQTGVPGSRCVQYSQWSLDKGATFSEPFKLLDNLASCPKQSDVIKQDSEFAVSLLNVQDEISFIAWNDEGWSRPQSQSELSTFLNPVTFDNVLFGCQNIAIHEDRMYMAGCDMGNGKDIWFRSRPLGSLEEWFPPASAWTSTAVMMNTRQGLSSLLTVADYENHVHSFWVQSPLIESEDAESTIVYSRWNEGQWSKPANILSGFSGIPTQLSATVDKTGKLLLSWVEGKNGDLYFSWANVERAHLASEWFAPQQLPSPSELNSSPAVLVDDLERIVVVYTVPFNEDRGVYIVQSTDLGRTWSQPTLVFDAVSAAWNSVDQPVVELSSDGKLHVLFTRAPLRDTDPNAGLYYTQSSDGGTTWSQPEVVSEKNIQWSRVVSFGQVIHRVWQEKNGSTFDIVHQVSQDAGASWDNSVKVLNRTDSSLLPGLAKTADGRLYIEQSQLEDETLVMEFYEWDGSRWISQESRELNIDSKSASARAAASVSSQGVLNAVISVVYPEITAELQNRVLSFHRSLNVSTENQEPAILQIPTPGVLPSPTVDVALLPTPTQATSIATLGGEAPSRRNQVGMILLGAVVLIIVIFALPRRKAK